MIPGKLSRPWSPVAIALPAMVVALLSMSGSAQAATFTVTTTADSNDGSCSASQCSLRDAIVAADAAGGSSTITLGAGTYTLTIDPTSAGGSDDPTTGDLDIDNNASITITGAGAGSSVIDADHVDRVFAIHAGSALSITGVGIENGDSGDENDFYSLDGGDGGAIYNDGTLSIADSALKDNSSWDDGGAIYSDSGAVSTTVSDSTLDSNNADDPGGAIEIEAGPLSLTGDTIDNNNADDGGAAVNDEGNGEVTISGGEMNHNTGYDGGGALAVEDTGAVSISDETFDANDSNDEDGGAIYASGTSSTALTITNSTFDDNSAQGNCGGAIYTHSYDIAVSGSTFAGNTAYCGGALYIEGSSSTASQMVTNSSFSGNNATSGGGLDLIEGDVSVTSSSLYDNQADEGGGIYYASGDAMSLTNVTLDSNQAAEDGGGLAMETDPSTGTVSLNSDTIAHNGAGYGGGGISYADALNDVENTIVADNYGSTQTGDGGADCYDAVQPAGDGGHNIDSDGTCFGGATPNQPTDQTADPLLGSIANNGGPVFTDALETGSPAIGAADGADCPSTDARGVGRSSTSCDIGAFQTAAADLGISAAGPASTVAGQPVTDVFTVTNNGPGPALGASVTDVLPSGASYFAASGSQGSCTGTGTVTCQLGALASGATATVTVVLIDGTAGTLSNSASISGSTTDPNAANNTAAATTMLTPSTTTITTTNTVTVPVTTTTTTTTTNTLTVPVTPVLITGVASQISLSGARVSASLNPGGAAGNYHFVYGTSKHKLNKSTKSVSFSASTAVRAVSVKLSKLKSNTTYYFEVVASNGKGVSSGQAVKFKTKKAPKKKKK